VGVYNQGWSTSNGNVDQLKARLIPKDYTRIIELDYGDTFSPIAKILSMQLFMSMVVIRHWPLH